MYTQTNEKYTLYVVLGSNITKGVTVTTLLGL